ncbi:MULTISPECIES: LPS translocon maturation chaperone LptM [unclassified Mesorhizobium]|uniref:LPS translocon maturation chaperone LptM n=1 Tax=unclassified Mesorhizobium TaxID=325217 RepID=UPI001929274D|nr:MULTISPECIES: lipoprotein [unclassified Mesorhizobium]
MTGSRIFVGLVLIAALGVAGCGRKAPLDTPYEAGMQARRDAERAGEPLPPAPEKPNLNKPFVLDPLL